MSKSKQASCLTAVAILLLCAGGLISPAARAATLIPLVPVPGSDPNSTGAIGINNNNVIVGNYTTDNYTVEHAFIGTLDGNYTTFDYGGNATGTQARGINDDGWVTAIATDNDCPLVGLCEFVRQPDGTIVDIEKDGAPMEGVVGGITAKQKLVGDYWTPDFHHLGYYGKGASYVSDLALPCCANTRPRAINKSGAAAGFYYTARGRQHGFLLQNGIATDIDYPDPTAYWTYVYGLNDNGLATGSWQNKRQTSNHAFELDTTTGVFTSLDIPGAAFTQGWGTNNAGLVAINSDSGGYIYCPRAKKKCPASPNAIEIPDPPSAPLTLPRAP